MMIPRSLPLALLFALILGAPLVAQDTRGSLLPDILLTLADGSTVKAEDLRAGRVLLSPSADGLTVGNAKVTAVRKQHTDSYYLLKTADRELHATGSHRIALADGRLVRLDTLKAGDRILMATAQGAQPAVVVSLRALPATLVAYDFTVEGHKLFVAGGLVVGD